MAQATIGFPRFLAPRCALPLRNRPPKAWSMLDGKRACVIGAGFGGLALAIRLQAAGLATTLIEARDKPGGRAYYWLRDGFLRCRAHDDPAARRFPRPVGADGP